MSGPHRIMIGTAGHVDHGKTSLVRRLTGVQTDTLAEEQNRGLSINLGFAPCFLDDDLIAGLVDVPGHEKFIRNMIAGATGLDLVMLVVAADDGVMPQTREHLWILDRLGVSRGLIVINKVDLVDSETVELVKMELEEILEGTFLAGAPMLEVSASEGTGIDNLREQLAKQARDTPAKRTLGFFRLPIQRVFTKTGIGCIVTGVPFAGHVSIGDDLEVLPAGINCRVRGLQAYGQAVEQAEAGHSVALNLAGVDYHDINRGDVICPPGLFTAADKLQVFFKPLPDIKWPKPHTEITLHVGTTTLRARVVWLEETDEAGCLAQLRLDQAVVAAPGDRFLMRDGGGEKTLGGGPIISLGHEAFGPGRREAVAALRDLHGRLEDVTAQLTAALLPPRVATIKELEKAVLRPEVELQPHLDQLLADSKLTTFRGLWFAPETPGKLTATMAHWLRGWYANHPEARWLQTSVLIETFGDNAWLIAQRDKEFAKELLISGLRVCRVDRLIDLNKAERQWADKLVAALDAGGFTPPLPDDIFMGMPSKVDPKKLLQALVDNGEILRLSAKVYWNHDTYDRARHTIKELCENHGQIDVAHVKESMGLSRKFAIPLLELMDKDGLTQRVGDQRQLVQS